MQYEIEGLQFEWNDEKAAQNLIRHGLKFSEAAEAFLDEQSLFEPNEGASGEASRLISARKADKNERQRYFEVCSEQNA